MSVLCPANQLVLEICKPDRFELIFVQMARPIARFCSMKSFLHLLFFWWRAYHDTYAGNVHKLPPNVRFFSNVGFQFF